MAVFINIGDIAFEGPETGPNWEPSLALLAAQVPLRLCSGSVQDGTASTRGKAVTAQDGGPNWS